MLKRRNKNNEIIISGQHKKFEKLSNEIDFGLKFLKIEFNPFEIILQRELLSE